MKRDVLGWLSLAATFVVTASAEYQLARACGFGVYVAGAVPAALDIYALRALRAGRDMAAVVVAMATVNALSHLVSADIIPVSWPLVVAVSCIAPLVMWRVHALREESPAAPVSAPVSVAADTPGYVLEKLPEPGYTPLPTPSTRYVGPFDKAPKSRPLFTPVAPRGSGSDQAGKGGSGGGVPGGDTGAGYVSETEVHQDAGVPDEPLDELTELARKEFEDVLVEGRTPSIRQLRDTYSIGQPRAQLIQRQLAPS
ncbi:hypothetical protein [Streptomyces mesophilus]|uniref:hypothetical protein n=1 Tax=Streptomyces mesophilus TaxID=1775132 RepID=UPI00332D066D